MKKTVLVCAAVLVLSVLVAAPARGATTFNWGLKAGVSFSNNAWSDDDGSEQLLFRPTFGAFALVNLTPCLAIQPEVDYLVTGERWQDEIEVVEEFTYLHIPVLVRYQFLKESKAKPFVAAGPAIGFLLSAKEMDEDVKQFFKHTDFGLEFGAGVQMPAGSLRVQIEARFYLGLTNAYDLDMGFSMKNRALAVTAGLVF
jgi:hypothetical protein